MSLPVGNEIQAWRMTREPTRTLPVTLNDKWICEDGKLFGTNQPHQVVASGIMRRPFLQLVPNSYDFCICQATCRPSARL